MERGTRIISIFKQLLSKISYIFSEIFFPSRCESCDIFLSDSNKNSTLCLSCTQSFYSAYTPMFTCSLCGRRIPELHCSAHPSAIPLFSLFQYSSNTPKDLIFAFKYRFFEDALSPFFPLIKTALFEYPELNIYDVLVPIPLHASRFRERGFNQAELIARIFSESSTPPLPIVHTLKRVKKTLHQAEIHDDEKRKENIAGAFKALPHIPPQTSIILVDDVFTTGATTLEAIRTLRALHPKNILIFTLFRAQ